MFNIRTVIHKLIQPALEHMRGLWNFFEFPALEMSGYHQMEELCIFAKFNNRLMGIDCVLVSVLFFSKQNMCFIYATN